MINESYIFSKDDLYINFDKFESGESNICLITGLSGSGKSTLGESLAKKYKAEYIELDIFEHSYMFENDEQIKEAGDVFYQYLSKHKIIKEKLKTKSIKGKELGKEINKFLRYVISYVNKNKNTKFIVEGVQIYSFGDPKIIKRYPLILVRASVSKSIKQRWLRNGNGKIEWKEELKELPPLLKWYLDEEKSFAKFRKDIMKEGDDMFEGLNDNHVNNDNVKETAYKTITECNTLSELNKQWFDFMMQPFDEQQYADKLCIENYNMTNRERYMKLYEDLSTRINIDNVNESVSTEFEPDFVNTVHNTSFISKLNDLPYFTPIDMSELGVFSKADSNYYGEPSDYEDNYDWYKAYDTLQYGVVPENFKELNKKRVKRLIELSKDFNNNKQKVLDLGWNPEVPFNIENRIKATESTRMKLLQCNNQFYDATRINTINETSFEKDKNPVYIIMVYTGSAFGKLIKRYTHGIYTHAAIAIDGTLDKLYSFNLANNYSKRGGFSIESLEGYIRDNKDGIMCVYTVFITDEQKRKLKKQLDYFTYNVDKTKYSIFNVFTMIVNKPVELANDMICSQFVDRMLKMIDMDITGKASALVTPNDLYQTTSTKVFKVFEGRLDEYDKRKSDRTVKKLSKSAITEKHSPIQFDKEGNLLILKDIKDIETEYNKSHKLLMSYDKTGNYDAMKPELCKLWYMNNKLEYIIFKTKKRNKEYEDMRARVLNDFNKYLKIVNSNDPTYVFSNDYDNSRYGDSSFKVSKHTLKYGIEYGKSLLRP